MLYIRLLVIICMLWTQSAYAVLDIEITQAVQGALPIAVAPFNWQGTRDFSVASIVRADLSRTGEFAVLPNRPQAYPEGDIDFDYWYRQGIEKLVVGEVTPLGQNKLKLTFSLLDVLAAKRSLAVSNPLPAPNNPLLQQEFIVSRNAETLRQLGHHLSDIIYERLTGVKGVFATRIAYVTVLWEYGKIKEYRLEIADADGYNPRSVLTSSEPIMSPSWSPDGKYLAYVSFERHRAQIYLSEVATGNREQLTTYPGINGAPSWSPDGKRLALVLSHGVIPKIFILDIKSKDLTQVTFGRAIDTEPRWLPDNNSLVFTSNRGGRPQIYHLDLVSGNIKRLTYEGSYNARPSITADGQAMVMIHGDDSGFHIAMQNINNGQFRILTDTRLDESPSLSPNGRMVLYSTTQAGKRILGAVSMDGRVKLHLPATEGEVQEPAWSPFLS